VTKPHQLFQSIQLFRIAQPRLVQTVVLPSNAPLDKLHIFVLCLWLLCQLLVPVLLLLLDQLNAYGGLQVTKPHQLFQSIQLTTIQTIQLFHQHHHAQLQILLLQQTQHVQIHWNIHTCVWECLPDGYCKWNVPAGTTPTVTADPCIMDKDP